MYHFITVTYTYLYVSYLANTIWMITIQKYAFLEKSLYIAGTPSSVLNTRWAVIEKYGGQIKERFLLCL